MGCQFTELPTRGQPARLVDRGGSFGVGVRDSAIGHVLSIGLLFASFAVAARVVSKGELGEFVLISVVVEFLGIFLDFGTRVTAIRFLSLEEYDQADVAGAAAGWWLLLGLAGGAAIGISSWVAAPRCGVTVGPHVSFLIGMMFCGQYVSFRFIGLLQGCHAYRRYALVQLLSSALRLAAIIILVAGFRLGLAGLLLSVTISGFGSIMLVWAALPVRIRPRIELRILRLMIPLALPVQASSLLSIVYERTDRVMLGIYHGASSVSGYEVAYRPLDQLRNVFESFRAVFLPHLSRLYAQGQVHPAEESTRQTLRVVSFVMTMGTVASLAWGRWVIETLFTAKYVESSRVLPVLMAGVSVGLCNYVISTALIASGRPRSIVFPSAVEALVNVLGNFALTPGFGAMGAATASLLSRMAVNPLFLVALGRDTRWRMASSFVRTLFSLAATWLVAAVFVGPSGDAGILTGALLLAFHVGLCLLLGAVRLADLRLVAGPLLSSTGSGGGKRQVGTPTPGIDGLDLVEKQTSEYPPSSDPRAMVPEKKAKAGLPR